MLSRFVAGKGLHDHKTTIVSNNYKNNDSYSVYGKKKKTKQLLFCIFTTIKTCVIRIILRFALKFKRWNISLFQRNDEKRPA